MLARALARQPRVLLLDEPTSALDLGHAQEVLDLVDRLRRQDGLTVLGTLHDLTLAGRYADRLALLSGTAGWWPRGRRRRWSPARTAPRCCPSGRRDTTGDDRRPAAR